MTNPSFVNRFVLMAVATLAFAWGGPAQGGTPAQGDVLLQPGQEALPLLERQDCGPAGADPCPKPGDASGSESKPTQASATAGLLPVGSPARPFALSDPDGNPIGLDAKTNPGPVLLIFWSLFCEPCKEELPFLDEMGQQYAPKGLRVLTVNIDGENMAKAATRYWQMNRFGFPMAMDRKDGNKFEAADAYGVTGTPSLFLIGRDGTVRWNHAGRLDPEVFRAELDRLLGS
ncbi:MAG: TlpA disulfide reductase family protein [Thermodesulfobacteriota bacterium]